MKARNFKWLSGSATNFQIWMLKTRASISHLPFYGVYQILRIFVEFTLDSYNHPLGWPRGWWFNLAFQWVLTVHRTKCNTLASCSSSLTTEPKLPPQLCLSPCSFLSPIVDRAILQKPKSDHNLPGLKTLQRLPITLMTKTQHSLAPAHICRLILDYLYLDSLLSSHNFLPSVPGTSYVLHCHKAFTHATPLSPGQLLLGLPRWR